MRVCKRCNKEFSIEMISKSYVQLNPESYEFCVFCRKYKYCIVCGTEYHHKQNKTCSKKCSEIMKIDSYLSSCGSTHNFCRESSSRIEWQNKLNQNEGITNVFQRESVKLKSKDTIMKKYGVDHISKLDIVKKSKVDKIKHRILVEPGFFKKKWWESHNIFINNLGYDPRLHLFGKASKESMSIFSKVLDFCNEIGLSSDDIFLGVENKNEFFLKEGKKIYFYDFTIRSINLIIEFHGVAFHAKSVSDTWFNPFTNESAQENIKKRKDKNNTAKKNGFKILEIWSDESVEKNIEYCKKFIKKNHANKVNKN